MLITKTPHRLSLCGGGTDYAEWAGKHGGLVLGSAVNKFTTVAVRTLPAFHDFKYRLVYKEIEEVNSLIDIKHRGLKVCLQYLQPQDEGLEISHAADLPGRAGTGSSSSFTVGLLNALHSHCHRYRQPAELAEEAIHVERALMGETVGCQDQVFAAYGGFSVLRIKPSGEVLVDPMTCGAKIQANLEARLMLIYLRGERIASKVAGTYVPALAGKTRDMWSLMRLADRAVEQVYRQDWYGLGRSIDGSWRIKRGLSPAVSNALVDEIYTKACCAGAYGGKLIGAGGGGCLLLVCDDKERVRRVLAGRPEVVEISDIKLGAEGTRVVHYGDKN